MTVLEGIQRSAEFLTRKGVDSPRLQAELLLAHVLKLERMRLYLNFDRALSQPEAEAFKTLVVRRGNREPLQQITGSTSFCGFEIAVNRHVLVPRPETELLAEKAWERVRSKVQSLKSKVQGLREEVQSPREEVQSPKSKVQSLNSETRLNSGIGARVLDLGTGSGCVAIAVAKNCAAARVVATDISAEALECAKGNAASNGVSDRIDFRLADGFAAFREGEQFDLIVSNPPYISTAEIEALQPEVRDWEPRTALDGGLDGLEWYRRIAAHARPHLVSNGQIMLEFGDGQQDAIRKIFEQEKWIVEAVMEDYTRRPRIVVVKREP